MNEYSKDRIDEMMDGLVCEFDRLARLTETASRPEANEVRGMLMNARGDDAIQCLDDCAELIEDMRSESVSALNDVVWMLFVEVLRQMRALIMWNLDMMPVDRRWLKPE